MKITRLREEGKPMNVVDTGEFTGTDIDFEILLKIKRVFEYYRRVDPDFAVDLLEIYLQEEARAYTTGNAV